MLNHLKCVHDIDGTNTSTSTAGKKQQPIDTFCCERERANRTCTPNAVTAISKLIAKMIAMEDLPMCAVEAEEFCSLIKFIEPDYKVTSLCAKQSQP